MKNKKDTSAIGTIEETMQSTDLLGNNWNVENSEGLDLLVLLSSSKYKWRIKISTFFSHIALGVKTETYSY